MGVFVLISKYIYDATIILQFEEPLFILITFTKRHCIFVLRKLHFAVFMGESLSPPPPVFHEGAYFIQDRVSECVITAPQWPLFG